MTRGEGDSPEVPHAALSARASAGTDLGGPARSCCAGAQARSRQGAALLPDAVVLDVAFVRLPAALPLGAAEATVPVTLIS